jgi:D-amino-acid oxidase
MRITVLGAGVIGLTSARRLAAAGHEVRVVADRGGAESTSGAAGAIWLPYLAQPADRVAAWGRDSYDWLTALAASEPDAGVVGRCELYVVADGDEAPSFAAALPATAELEYVPAAELPAESRLLAAEAERPPAGAWRFLAPVVHPARHLAWLANGTRGGLEIEIRAEPVTRLDALPGELVVNCTGPRAGALVDDPLLTPTLGQVIVADAPPAPFGWADERWPDRVFYGFPRDGDAILGGCSVPGSELDPTGERPWERPGRPEPREEVSRQIAARWRRAGASLPPELIQAPRVQAGWRPVRSEVRVERSGQGRGRVIHNYGHGGAGYTLAYGCAGSVVELAGERRGMATT